MCRLFQANPPRHPVVLLRLVSLPPDRPPATPPNRLRRRLPVNHRNRPLVNPPNRLRRSPLVSHPNLRRDSRPNRLHNGRLPSLLRSRPDSRQRVRPKSPHVRTVLPSSPPRSRPDSRPRNPPRSPPDNHRRNPLDNLRSSLRSGRRSGRPLSSRSRLKHIPISLMHHSVPILSEFMCDPATIRTSLMRLPWPQLSPRQLLRSSGRSRMVRNGSSLCLTSTVVTE